MPGQRSARASAIVIEVSTGIVACERAADKRLRIGSTTKLMTALLTLENAKLSDTFTAVGLPPAADRVARSGSSRASG